MDNSLRKKACNRTKRAMRVRSRLRGTSEQPRLCVVKSNRHLHAQLIDDESAVTLASTSTLAKEFGQKNKEMAKRLGLKMGELTKGKNVKSVIFDRGPSKFHGVIAAFAEGVREAGVEV